MAKPKASTSGIPGIYRQDTVAHAVFFTIHHARRENPGRAMNEIAESVLTTFNLKDTTVGSALKIYYRAEEAYLENGGL